jgi:hypothetical protein
MGNRGTSMWIFQDLRGVGLGRFISHNWQEAGVIYLRYIL